MSEKHEIQVRFLSLAHMFFAYVLFSEKIQKKYVGSTQNLEKRLEHHNLGLNRWSKNGAPWKLIHSEAFQTRTEAIKREHYLKTGAGRNFTDSFLPHI